MDISGTWEDRVNISSVVELSTAVRIFLGAGALQKITTIAGDLRKDGIEKIIITTDETVYAIAGIEDVVVKALNEKGISCIVFSGVQPNPTVDIIDEAARMGTDFGAQAVIGIGGGSHIDTAKSAAVLMHGDYRHRCARELYEHTFAADKALPIVAINTTHGTGSEISCVAVATIEEKGLKPGIVSRSLYPRFAVEDPTLTCTLPPNQTTYTSLDAVNHALEAATTAVTSPYSIMLSREAVRLVAEYLPKVQKDPENVRARYFLMYASFIATISADNALLHITHALEHPLSALNPGVHHGLGLAILLPSVIKTIYPAQPEVLAEILRPIVPDLKGIAQEATAAAGAVEQWLAGIGVKQKLGDLGFTQQDIHRLVELAQTTPTLDVLLSVAPVQATPALLRQIYTDSFAPLCR